MSDAAGAEERAIVADSEDAVGYREGAAVDVESAGGVGIVDGTQDEAASEQCAIGNRHGSAAKLADDGRELRVVHCAARDPDRAGGDHGLGQREIGYDGGD